MTILETVQFAWGGFFDESIADAVRVDARRTPTDRPVPNPSVSTLCGLDMFAPDAPRTATQPGHERYSDASVRDTTFRVFAGGTP